MTLEADKDQFSASPLFSSADPETVRALRRVGGTHSFDKGEVLDFEGQDCLAILLSGAVALSVQEADRVAILSTVRAPATLNLACVLARADCEIRWRALQGGVALILPGQPFRDALARDVGLATRAFGELAAAHQQLLSGAASQRLLPARSRVVSYLLSLTAEHEGAVLVRLPYDKHVLASLLGMTPENFSREMSRLSAQGVTVRGGDVHIGRVEHLRTQLARGFELPDH